MGREVSDSAAFIRWVVDWKRSMEGKMGSTMSKWWRERRGDCGWEERKPDMSPRRSICIHASTL
ncbi:hypothetical protein U1Q18_032329 [Sarracenia purpurea var. burkii]